MNGSGDASVAVAIHQLVSEAVVLAVGAHARVTVIHLVCEIHFAFSLIGWFLNPKSIPTGNECQSFQNDDLQLLLVSFF